MSGEGCSELERIGMLRREVMAQSEWLESLYLQSVAARPQLAETHPGFDGLCFPACWLVSLPDSLKPVADRLINGQRVLGDILRIRRAIVASDQELVSYDRALSSLEPRSLPFWLGPIVAERTVNSDMVLRKFGKVVATLESGAAFWLLLEFLWPVLEPIHQSGLKYYGIDQSGAGDTQTRQALFAAVFTSTVTCSLVTYRRLAPEQAIPVGYFHLLLGTIKEQFLLMLGILGRVQARESGYADIGLELARIEDEREFIETFHSEWERVLQFEDGFYGFHVMPNTGWTDMVRYLEICYRGDNIQRKVNGYRKEISWEVTTFRVHQATVSASLVRVLNPEAAEQEYRKAVNLALEPLVQAAAKRVASVRWRCEGKDGKRQGYVEAALPDARSVLDGAYDKFSFHLKESEEAPFSRPYGLLRLSGEHVWRVPPLFHEQLEGARPRPSKELPFVHHVGSSLGRWVSCEVRKVYHPGETALAETDDSEAIAHVRQRQRAKEEWDGAVFEAPDGAKYITIVQLSKKLGCPVHQLRRFDKELGVQRVSDVFGSLRPSLGRVKLKGQTRLYELRQDDDLVHRASQLVGCIGKPLADCKTKGITRAQLCREYGIAKSTVLHWEEQGTVKPVREKGHVIYTKDQEDLASRFARKLRQS